MDIKLDIHRQYKSFKEPFEAKDLNDFIVLTGKNGAGKSQLLQIIDQKQFIDQQNPQVTPHIEINSKVIAYEDILGIFSWTMSNAPTAGQAESNGYLNQLTTAVTNYLGNNQPFDKNTYSPLQVMELKKIAEELSKKGYDNRSNHPPLDLIFDMLSKNFQDHSAQIVNERIASIIFDWYISSAEDLLENKPVGDQSENPIKIFNSLCKEFELKYHLVEFVSLKINYIPVLIDNNTDDKVSWAELSSGEMVLFRVVCWLFYYKMKKAYYPKLLLLDEPDAHLTPLMIRKLLDTLHNVLVDNMGIAVIMTTHSPNTVALADESSLYDLKVSKSGKHKISKITRKYALNTFSEGLLFVQEDTRLIFIEGKDDTKFYDQLYISAISRHRLNSIPSFKFITASKNNKDEGGCEEVKKMVTRFKDTTIEKLVHGIIDNDNKNTSSGNLWVLERYSIENYMYDPLIMACALIMKSKHKFLNSIKHIGTNDLKTLTKDAALVQNVVSEILSKISADAGNVVDTSGPKSKQVKVKWRIRNSTKSLSYTLPIWFISLKKSELKKTIYLKGGPLSNLFKVEDLYIAIDSIGALPDDIMDIFKNIQKA